MKMVESEMGFCKLMVEVGPNRKKVPCFDFELDSARPKLGEDSLGVRWPSRGATTAHEKDLGRGSYTSTNRCGSDQPRCARCVSKLEEGRGGGRMA